MKKDNVSLPIGLVKLLHKTANPEAKKEVESIVGKEALSAPFIERVASVDDCYEEAELPKVDKIEDIPAEFHAWLLKQYEGAVVAKAFNGETRLSMRNPDQKRYQAWLRCSPSGFSYHDSNFNASYALAGDASRTLFLSPEAAKRAFEISPDTYEGIANL